MPSSLIASPMNQGRSNAYADAWYRHPPVYAEHFQQEQIAEAFWWHDRPSSDFVGKKTTGPLHTADLSWLRISEV